MPDSGSSPTKTFIRADGSGRTGADLHAQQKAVGVKIKADLTDVEAQEMAVALTNRRMLDGGNQPSADLPMNSFKHTGVANATARTNYAALGQVQDSTSSYGSTSSGTDTIAITLTPAITAYAAGQRFHFLAGGTNTGAATLNANAVGAKNLRKGPAGSVALAAGDITAGGMYDVEYDGTNMQLLNPGLGRAAGSVVDITGTTAETTPAVADELLMYDASATANRKVTLANFFKVITGLTAETSPAVDDEVALYDLSATSGDKITLQNLLKVVNALTEDTTPDIAADFVLSYDTSASLPKKVKNTNLIVPGALIAIIVDRKSAGTAPQNISSSSDTVRTLNTLDYNRNTTVSLGGGTTGTDGTANQITLPAGSWEIRWSAPAYQSGGHQTILRDVTAGADLVRGTSEIAINNGSTSRSFGVWRVTPAGSNVYEIRHRAGITAQGGDDLNLGVEVYTRVEIYAA